MSTVAIRLPDTLEANLARPREKFQRKLHGGISPSFGVDATTSELDSVLTNQMSGPFASLEEEWKEHVRSASAKRTEA